MMITLLLDLDDTLLDTNVDAFIPAYFSGLSAALADRVAPDTMLPALMGGTQAMMASQDPARTLEQVFDDFFYPQLGIPKAELRDQIEHFYDETFPTIQHVTGQRPEAVAFVDWSFASGHRVAIATNPYFPLKAVHHRMRWAGLAPEVYRFALISAFEGFHFTKETGAYFYEFLGQLGWPSDPVVMVGNDLDMDLLPALKVGLPVFWLRDGRDGAHPGIPQGSFADLRRWLEQADPEGLHPSIETPEAVAALLRSTPAAIATLTSGLSDQKWLCEPLPGEWCLTEILCHLRDVDVEVNLERLRRVLAEDNPFISAEDTDRWAEERQYRRQDGRQALADLIAARKELLALLDDLQASQWSRPARHAIFGPMTLQELVTFVAEHDRIHVQQVWKTV
ncbi:MAG: DinB family protein [Anaerolineales bacterium]|nr:DinB family protein [Anaerolineales bacterium]